MDLSLNNYDDDYDSAITSIDIFNDSKELLTNYDTLKKTNISKPIMSKYERATVIGIRAQQISSGAIPLIDVPKHLTNSIDIAEYELNKRKTPFIVSFSRICEKFHIQEKCNKKTLIVRYEALNIFVFCGFSFTFLGQTGQNKNT